MKKHYKFLGETPLFFLFKKIKKVVTFTIEMIVWAISLVLALILITILLFFMLITWITLTTFNKPWCKKCGYWCNADDYYGHNFCNEEDKNKLKGWKQIYLFYRHRKSMEIIDAL